jgi:hypothetical protein
MKNKLTETFQIKLSNWHYKICVDNAWVNCGLIESKGNPSFALPPQISELQKILPGYTYTTSRESLWHLFAPHTTDDGAGDEEIISIDLNPPSDQGCNQDSDPDNLEATDSETTTTSITFKIYQGTTYYSYDGNWEPCQVQTGTDPIVPPPIATINDLNKKYAYYSYQSLSAADTSFASHQGSSGLGDGESFPIVFNVPLETITMHFMIAPDYSATCPMVGGEMVGSYSVIYSNTDWVILPCVTYGIPKGRSYPWVYPPTNDQLEGNTRTANLRFTPDQYNTALPIFMSQSGINLQGMEEDFSVQMSRIKTK